MRLVIDGSVVLDACLAASGFELLVGHDAAAPPLVRSEVLSVLRELRWRGEISQELARQALDRLIVMPVQLERASDHEQRSWQVAERLGWAKTYDAEYVALAEYLGCPLLTRDERLYRGAIRVVQTLTPAGLT
jgi:predicted nucleic acid-binding protein